MEFNLPDEFVLNYKDQGVAWGPLGYPVYKRTYARKIVDLNTRLQLLAKEAGHQEPTESWWLTCTRVVEGTYYWQKKHVLGLNLPWSENKAIESAKVMFDLMFRMLWLPPGRGLLQMGTDFIKENGGASLNNCGMVSTEHSLTEACCWLMGMLMLGVGVGFDTLGAGKFDIVEPELSGEPWVVDDTREGWVEALWVTLEAFQGRHPLPEFDCSKIRKKGVPIKGFGGVSSGPDPLIKLLADLRVLLYSYVGCPVSSRLITDVDNMIGVCVVSGNVRRSAQLALGNEHDTEFLDLKDYLLNPERASFGWTSNNAVGVTADSNFHRLSRGTALGLDLGFIWLENCRDYGRMCDPPSKKDSRVKGMNPCCEQTLESYELCCLVETFPALHHSYEHYERTLKYAYLYAKTVALIPTHDARTNAVMLRNRRIGCSQSGIIQAINKFGYAEYIDLCKKSYGYICGLDDVYSDWLCVPTSIKKTSVKPSGTVSQLNGSTPGIHHPHSEYYYRLMRLDAEDPLAMAHEQAGYHVADLRPDEPNTKAIYFAVHEKNFVRCKDDVTLWEQMELAADLQEYYADNAVSCTVTFKDEEAKDIPYALEKFSPRLKCMSFLRLSDDRYKHMPYQKISKETYDYYIKGLSPVDLGGIELDTDAKFCDSDRCET